MKVTVLLPVLSMKFHSGDIDCRIALSHFNTYVSVDSRPMSAPGYRTVYGSNDGVSIKEVRQGILSTARTGLIAELSVE